MAQYTRDAGQGLMHIDIPLSIDIERNLLCSAGLTAIEVLWEEVEAAVLVAS